MPHIVHLLLLPLVLLPLLPLLPSWPEVVYRAMVQGLAPRHPAPWPSFPPKGPWPPVSALVEGRGWRRGLVLEEVGGATYRVFLCDEGEVAVLPAASLCPIATCSLPRQGARAWHRRAGGVGAARPPRCWRRRWWGRRWR